VTTIIVSHQPAIVPDKNVTAAMTAADVTARLAGVRAACDDDAVPME